MASRRATASMHSERFVGFFLSRQMTAFQLNHIASLADPFFGLGTQRVLTSDVSRAFPIPGAGLDAVAYMIEFLMGFMGDQARWQTMPWMVTFFGILVVPLGIVSVTLIILQPVAVGAWCTPCLIAAAAMLVMIPLTLDEVVATLQFLVQARREGQPLWQTFWMGGALRGHEVIHPSRTGAKRSWSAPVEERHESPAGQSPALPPSRSGWWSGSQNGHSVHSSSVTEGGAHATVRRPRRGRTHTHLALGSTRMPTICSGWRAHWQFQGNCALFFATSGILSLPVHVAASAMPLTDSRVCKHLRISRDEPAGL